MTTVVLQPMYLPWMGYFGLIERADTFVFYDDVQFVRDSWQRRNRIKIPESSGEVKWLSVPVVEDFGQDIDEVRVDQSRDWCENHETVLRQAYGPESIPFGSQAAPHFDSYIDDLASVYERSWESLAELTIHLIERITDLLEIETPEFRRSSEFELTGSGTERLIDLLDHLGTGEYVSGPGAKEYLDIESFEQGGIGLYWHEFDHPEYVQLYGDFVSHLSVVDVLFNCGPEAAELIREGEADALVREV